MYRRSTPLAMPGVCRCARWAMSAAFSGISCGEEMCDWIISWIHGNYIFLGLTLNSWGTDWSFHFWTLWAGTIIDCIASWLKLKHATNVVLSLHKLKNSLYILNIYIHIPAYLYVSIDIMFGSPLVDPLALRNFLLFWDIPQRIFPITVKPNQDLAVNLAAGPPSHLGKLWHWRMTESLNSPCDTFWRLENDKTFSAYLYLHMGFSHTCHHSPETAIHETGTLCSFPLPVLPQPGWHPGEGSRHPPRGPSHLGPETLPPAHLGRWIRVRRNFQVWAVPLEYIGDVRTWSDLTISSNCYYK